MFVEPLGDDDLWIGTSSYDELTLLHSERVPSELVASMEDTFYLVKDVEVVLADVERVRSGEIVEVEYSGNAHTVVVRACGAHLENDLVDLEPIDMAVSTLQQALSLWAEVLRRRRERSTS